MKTLLSLAVMFALFSLSAFTQDIPSASPILGKTDIDKGFGPRLHPVLDMVRSHNGADFVVPLGTKVLTTAHGTVSEIGEDEGYGIYVRVQHSDGYETLYAHLSKSVVSRGQLVKFGSVIAESGNSGKSSGPHLHYEVIKDGKNVDPKGYISAS
jgi:murein DD-endopeptidase MepM/ murein hydrolase activator NlpD